MEYELSAGKIKIRSPMIRLFGTTFANLVGFRKV